jgi:hypothetical protein
MDITFAGFLRIFWLAISSCFYKKYLCYNRKIKIMMEMCDMYTVIDNPKRMTKNEIRTLYDKKWVFAVEGDYDIGVPLKTAIPIVIADSAWEGREDGIYTRLKEKYGRTLHLSFLSDELNVFGFSEVLTDE